MKLHNLMLAIPLLAGAVPAFAATTTPVINIRLDHGSVWKATGKQKVTEGFIQIHNDGDTDDTLTAWTCPNAEDTVLMGKDGKPLSELTIPAKQTVTLAPGGIFLDLKDLHYPVERGSIIPCSFTFKQAGLLGGFLNEVKRPKT